MVSGTKHRTSQPCLGAFWGFFEHIFTLKATLHIISFPNFILSTSLCKYIYDHKSSNKVSSPNCQIRETPFGESWSSKAVLGIDVRRTSWCLLRPFSQSRLHLLKILHLREDPCSAAPLLALQNYSLRGAQSNEQRVPPLNCRGPSGGCVLSQGWVRSTKTVSGTTTLLW